MKRVIITSAVVYLAALNGGVEYEKSGLIDQPVAIIIWRSYMVQTFIKARYLLLGTNIAWKVSKAGRR